MDPLQDALDLVDWRRQVADLYRLDAVQSWRRERDRLLRSHPQSPIPEEARAAFNGISYFPFDPALRLEVELEPGDGGELGFDTGGEDGVVRARRVGLARFRLAGEDCGLSLFALAGYGGGLFLPFADGTSGVETYGGGRYLVDTVKQTGPLAFRVMPGSRRVTLDFNLAYYPSCAYSPRWACPLAPPENRLRVPVRAGERGAITA